MWRKHLELWRLSDWFLQHENASAHIVRIKKTLKGKHFNDAEAIKIALQRALDNIELEKYASNNGKKGTFNVQEQYFKYAQLVHQK